jgi:hypothetical protein
MAMTSIPPAPRRPAKQVWSVVTLVLGIVLAPIAFIAHHTVVLATETDRVTDAIEPLLDNPDVQAGLVGAVVGPLDDFLVTDQVLQRIADQAQLDIDVPDFLDDAVTALVQPLVDQTLERVRDGVARIIASDPFARSWRQIVADTHEELSGVLAGDDYVEGKEVSLNLRPFLQDIQQGLIDQGFDFLGGVPLPDVRLSLLEPDTVTSLRGFVHGAMVIDPWSAGLAGVLIVAGIVFAPVRSRAWVVAGGGVAAGMVTIVVALWAYRTVVIPLNNPQTAPILQPVADALFAYPISQALTIAVIAATVGGVGWLVESRIIIQRAMS